jgi:hypothetical protein
MSKGRRYSVRIGRPGRGSEDVGDPPFFQVEADSVTLDEQGTLSIKSGGGNRVLRAHMWELCEIRRNTASDHSPEAQSAQ